MAFVITEQDIKQIAGMYKKNLPELIETVNNCKASINAFVWNESFKGSAAESMKAYMKEVHGTMLDHIGTIAEILQDRMQSYVKGIYHYESGPGFVLPEETIGNLRESVFQVTNKTLEYEKSINDELRSIGSIISVDPIKDDTLTEETLGIMNRAEQLCRNISMLEKQYVAYLRWPKAYIDSFKNNLGEAGVGSLGEIRQYQSGSMEKLPCSEIMAVLSKIEKKKTEGSINEHELDLSAQEKKSLADIVVYMIPEAKVELNGPKVEIPIAPGVTVYSMMKSNSGDLSPEDIQKARERVKTAIQNQNGTQVTNTINWNLNEKEISTGTDVGNNSSFSGGPSQFSCKYQTKDGVVVELKFIRERTKTSIEEGITVPAGHGEIETDYGMSFYKEKDLSAQSASEISAETISKIKAMNEEYVQFVKNAWQVTHVATGAAALLILLPEIIPSVAPYLYEMGESFIESTDWTIFQPIFGG